jgi:hemin uptake protein HemP
MKIKPTLLDVLTFSSLSGNKFIDSMDLFEDSKEIHIEHGRDKYILKINDQDELELILNTDGLH